MIDLESICDDLKEIAQQAGQLALSSQKKVKIGIKSNRKDLVTSADLAVENLILKKVRKYGFNVLSEEKGYLDKASPYTLIIDPIDGTTNFSQGHPDWAVSIALEKEKQILAGVVHSPSDKKTYSTIKGKGSFLNNERIDVSQIATLEQSFINCAYLDNLYRFHELIGPIWDDSLKTDIMGSMAKSFCYVAQGIYSASVGLSSSIWDYAAANLIVEEAGGKVTDFFGNLVDYSKKKQHIIVSNGIVHRKIIDILKKVDLKEVVQNE